MADTGTRLFHHGHRGPPPLRSLHPEQDRSPRVPDECSLNVTGATQFDGGARNKTHPDLPDPARHLVLDVAPARECVRLTRVRSATMDVAMTITLSFRSMMRPFVGHSRRD
jgi:hypothetical protein